MSQDTKDIIGLVVSWRVIIWVAVIVITRYVGFIFPYPKFEQLIELGKSIPALWSWGGFDGVHYLTIAQYGYIEESTQAFFPTYPLLVRWMTNLLATNVLVGGLVVSNFMLVVAMVLFWKLLRLDFNRAVSRLTIWLLLLFPTAYYLGAVYSESTFLVFVFGSFLAARRKNWLVAGILAAIASASRLVGIFLFPALLVEWYQPQSPGKKHSLIKLVKKKWRELVFIFISPLGLISYMWYLRNSFNDPLKFLHVQSSFGASRTDKMVLLYQVIWRYIKMIFTVDPTSQLYFRVMQELGWSLVFLFLAIISFKQSRLSYALFSVLAFLAPTLTGTFSSMPRYVLVMFPGFILLAQWLGRFPRARKVWYIFSAVLFLINLSLFITGRWVA